MIINKLALPDFALIGHRGCRGQWQENSRAAIAWAYAEGAAMVEIDLWQVEDELVLIHDRRAHQYLQTNTLITDCRLADLRAVMDVPSLRQALALVPSDKMFNIEIKDNRIVEACVAEIDQLVAEGVVTWRQLLFSSFDHRVLEQLKQCVPDALIGALYEGVTLGMAEELKVLAATSVHLGLDFVDESIVKTLKRQGFAVFVYTVNDLEDALLLRSWGVDGIFCDDIKTMRSELISSDPKSD